MKLSIITAVFNRNDTIQHALESVRDQTYNAVEHIIIDGGSTDGTLDVINANSETLDVWVSEKDKGLYDALNKGIALASGDVVGFLHSDDLYAGPGILARVAKLFRDSGCDACYGDLVYVKPEDTHAISRYWKSGPYHYRRIFWGWMPPHPTFFMKKSIYEMLGGFRLDMGSAADYEMMLRSLLKQRISAAYLPEVMVKMRSGGMSNASAANRIKANHYDRMAWQVNHLTPYPWTLCLKPLSKIKQFFQKPPEMEPAFYQNSLATLNQH